MNFTFYDAAGAIQLHGHAPRESVERMHAEDYPDFAWLEGDYAADTHCIVGGQPTLRTPVPHRVEGVRLSGLPSPCELRFDGHAHRIEGGTVELAFDAVGSYEVVLRSLPRHLDTTVEIRV